MPKAQSQTRLRSLRCQPQDKIEDVLSFLSIGIFYFTPNDVCKKSAAVLAQIRGEMSKLRDIHYAKISNSWGG